jgi:hypothetical protein
MSAVTIKLISGDQHAEAFVLNSWLRSYERRGRVRNGIDPRFAFKSHTGPLIASADYYRTHHPELQRLVRRSRIALAVLTEDHDVYLGWACGTAGVLHYVYTKYVYRTAGIARALVREVCGDGPLMFTFEPSNDRGKPRRMLMEVAERKGYTFHPHPIPGVEVFKQLQERNA